MAAPGLSPNVFNAGAVKLNTEPEVALYGQLLQRQQAKKDALNQYYQKAVSDVTPTGMRNQDVVGGWSKKLNDLQEFAMNPDNKKYLENPRLDGYKTATQFNQMHSYLLNDVQKSKEAGKNEQDMFGLLKEGKLALTGEQDPKTGNWTPGSDMDIKSRMAKSIYDPTRLDRYGKQPDPMDLSFTHQFTPLQETQMYNDASKGIPKSKVPDPTNQRIDKAEQMIYTPYKTGFNSDQVKTIADNFSNALTPAASSHYETLMKEPNNYANWTNAYQSVYGKTNPDGSPNLLDTPLKAAKAVAILHANAETGTGEDKAPNKAAITENAQSFQLLKQKIGHQNSIENILLGAKVHGNDPATINQNVDGIISQHIANSKTLGGEVPMSAETFKILTGAPMTRNSVAKVDDAGNYTYGTRELDKDGKPTGNILNQKTIPYTEAKTALTKGYKTGLSGAYNTGTKPPPIVKPTVHTGKVTSKGLPIIH